MRFPTRIRARAVGFIIAFFLRDFGTTGVFVFIGSAMACVVGVIAIFGPKTTGPRLEEISK